MKKMLKLFSIEIKQGFRSPDMLIFGIAMPVGILLLISMIAGGKMAGTEGYTYLESAFASLISVGICASAFMGFPLTVADYRDKKILKHFFVTPCSPARLLGAVVCCGVIQSVLSAVAVFITAKVLFDYEMKGDLLFFLFSWVLTLVSMFSIGLLMASMCRTVKSTNAITSLVYFPMLFLSGATIPFEIFPEGLQKVAELLPLSQGIKLMKMASTGIGMEGITGKVILLLMITVICSIISVKMFRWE